MLSKLTQIQSLRKIWPDENKFTEWLAKEENLSLLMDEIGLEISNSETEASIGEFSVDILAEEEGEDRKIVIENQLENTNHDHLGKIITYASGYDANVIIWIVSNAREEHQKAVEWLNEHTDEKVNFFLVELELYKIDKSNPAVKFNIVIQPNNWAKYLKQTKQRGITDVKRKQLEFWTQLKEYGRNLALNFKFRTPRPQHWYDISIGSSEAHAACTLNSFEDRISVELYIPDNKDLFENLFKKKSTIEKDIGEKFKWMRLPKKKASGIRIDRKGNIDNEDDWENYFKWLIEKISKFKKVFPKYL
ncbi:DUF4268 domain-containing protein [Candidatus Dojkabacteria bacterium]|nr:DUF4268 domain-containing protein [Candidatus Dojkabacteria bacterium]